MTDKKKGIEFFRQKIITYYEELVNTIDIKTEEFLLRKNIQCHEIDEINARRNEWIQRIKLVGDQNIFDLENNANLDTLNLLIDEKEQLNHILFNNGFLFFSQNKPYSDDDPLFIGKLVYKNGYLNKNVIQKYEFVL